MFDLDQLNPPQRAAVTHGSGPLLLLAGAGSGKTRVITSRIVHLFRQGVSANRILAVTFTNKAAREMRERVQEIIGFHAARGMTIATFHSLCVQILKSHIGRLGFKQNFSIYASGDQQRLIRDLLRDSCGPSSARDAEQVLWRISAAKNRLVDADRYQANPRDPLAALVAQIYPRYQRALKAYNAVDFDDLLLLCVRLLEQHEDLQHHYQERFAYQMVDEYQDTNPVQYRLLKLLAAGHGNLCVVGDDDQSIYAFRGADVANILDFEKDFPGTRVIKLEQNYRSSGNILNAANALIAHNQQRRAKALWTSSGAGAMIDYLLCSDSEDEARQVVELIHAEKYRHQRNYGDFAILYRTNSQARAFEEQLRYENIPYVLIGGQQFFDRKEIRDLVGYLRTILNPNDEVSLLRILNYPRRGIGTSSTDLIIRHSAATGQSIWSVLQQPEQVATLNQKTHAAIAGFVALIRRYQGRFKNPLRLTDSLRELLNELQLAEEIYRQEKDPQTAQRRVENQEDILNSLAAYLARSTTPSLSGFLDAISLFDEDGPGQQDKDKKLASDSVTLMSLHASKGLEFPVVFLVGMEEGFLPHKKSIDVTFDIAEERRLCYVGITRAQRRLILLGARQRRKHGKLEQREPSRFLAELPAELLGSNLVSREQPVSAEQEQKSASHFFQQINQLLGT
jgi:superfamily I DNA/RNA helicase